MKNNTQPITLDKFARPFNELMIRLTGPNGEEWLSDLHRFLRKENPQFICKWKVWTIARMGSKVSLIKIEEEIRSRGFKIQYGDIHGSFTLVSLSDQLKFNLIEEDVYFTLASPHDLGLKPGWTKRQLLDAADAYGLMPCLSGDVLEILAQGKFDIQRSNGKDIRAIDIAMEPLMFGKTAGMFCIAKYDYYHLGYHNGDLSQIWSYPGNVNNKHLFRIKIAPLA